MIRSIDPEGRGNSLFTPSTTIVILYPSPRLIITELLIVDNLMVSIVVPLCFLCVSSAIKNPWQTYLGGGVVVGVIIIIIMY